MADNQRLYNVLGVPRDADAKAIKKAYRKLAQQYHPDVNKEAGAEDKFKEINRAHEVLSSPERRALYDKYGEISLDPNFNEDLYNQQQAFAQGFGQNFYSGQGGAAYGGFDFSDLFGQGGSSAGSGSFGGFDFSDLFGNGAQGGFRQRSASQAPVKGEDQYASLDIDFMESINGKTETITFDLTEPDANGTHKTRQVTLEVKIPAGIKDGQKIRIPGKGEPGIFGGPNGDLYIEIKVNPSKVFSRKDNDIYVTVPVSLPDAVLGGTIEVPTVYGPVDMKIPAGIQSGQKLRLSQKGVKTAKGTGDEYAKIKVEIPKNLTKEQREILEQIKAAQNEAA
jgi:DnaJ-class molecular chaperone